MLRPEIIFTRPKDSPSRRVPVTCGRLCAAAIWENPMPRLRHVPGLHQAVLVGLAAMLVVSCSETVDKAPATASDQPQAAAPQIVVTGQRRDEALAELKDGPAPVEAYAAPPPAAPPPPPSVVTADNMARVRGVVAAEPWSTASPVLTAGKATASLRIASGYQSDFRAAPPPYHD